MKVLNTLQRYLIIIRKIKLSGGITLEELMQAVKNELQLHGVSNIATSTRTLKRDIEGIRKDLHVPVDYSRIRGYYIPIDEDYPKEYLESLLESFDILNVLNADTGIEHIVFPERQKFSGTEYLYPLLQAAREQHRVSFRYQKFNEGHYTERNIAPYALKECHGRWYVLGIQEGEKQLKTFGLDRLSILRKRPEKFRRQKDIDVPAIFKDFFGIMAYSNLPTEEVIISFKEWEGKYVESLPIHPSQQTIPHPTDRERMMFRLNLKITDDLIMELFSRGFTLKVHSPEHLRLEICRRHREALKINRR